MTPASGIDVKFYFVYLKAVMPVRSDFKTFYESYSCYIFMVQLLSFLLDSPSPSLIY